MAKSSFPFSNGLLEKPKKGQRRKIHGTVLMHFPDERPRLHGLTYAIKDRSRPDYLSFMWRVESREKDRAREREYAEMDRKLSAVGLTIDQYARLRGEDFDRAQDAMERAGK